MPAHVLAPGSIDEIIRLLRIHGEAEKGGVCPDLAKDGHRLGGSFDDSAPGDRRARGESMSLQAQAVMPICGQCPICCNA